MNPHFSRYDNDLTIDVRFCAFRIQKLLHCGCVDKYVYLTSVKSLLRCFLFAVPGFGFHFSSCRALDIPLEEDCGMFDLAHHATGV